MSFPRWLPGISMVIGLLGCGWLADETPTSQSSGLPDLVVEYESTWDICSATEFYQAVIVSNQGTADAPAFRLFINDRELRTTWQNCYEGRHPIPQPLPLKG